MTNKIGLLWKIIKLAVIDLKLRTDGKKAVTAFPWPVLRAIWMFLWLKELIHLGTFIITQQGLNDDLILSYKYVVKTKQQKNPIICVTVMYSIFKRFFGNTLDEGTHIDH